jgi:hypothetical protein
MGFRGKAHYGISIYAELKIVSMSFFVTEPPFLRRADFWVDRRGFASAPFASGGALTRRADGNRRRS